MLRQIGWWVQHGPNTKNGVLPVTNIFFGKRLSFIWQCFFPVIILDTIEVNSKKKQNKIKSKQKKQKKKST